MTKSVPLEKRTPHKANSDKMTTLEKLTKDRSVAKGRVTVYINSLNALLATEGPEAQSANIKADNDLKKLDSAYDKFKAAHIKVCDFLEEAETDEDKIEGLIKTNEAYLNQVRDSVYKIGELDKKFRARLKLTAIKENLLAEIGAYKLQRVRLTEHARKVDTAEGFDSLNI